jgi:ribonucleoside-diphosphate reductase beta chain
MTDNTQVVQLIKGQRVNLSKKGNYKHLDVIVGWKQPVSYDNAQDYDVDVPSAWNYIRAVIANYMLEGIYFYNGFQFFHNLANRGLISGTDTQISYIQRDEIVHCTIFENIIKQIKKEYPEIWSERREEIIGMFKLATEWEIRFSVETIGDKILGMNTKSITDYAHFLCDYRLENIGETAIYGVKVNPYKHLEKQAGVSDETSNRSNNFEVTSITYKSPEILSGWSEL